MISPARAAMSSEKPPLTGHLNCHYAGQRFLATRRSHIEWDSESDHKIQQQQEANVAVTRSKLGASFQKDTNSCPQPSTALRALQTPEILEQILLHLPLTPLLLSQRVSKYWKTVLATSPKLQQALYLRPAPTSLPPPTHHANPFNPLLQEVFPEWFDSSSYISPTSRDNREYIAYIPMQRSDPARFTRPEASWRRMYFQHPYHTKQETTICIKQGDGSDPYSVISLPSDYIMGQVYDSITQCAQIPLGDDLPWLFLMPPGRSQEPHFGPRAEELVQKRWRDRRRWREKYFGRVEESELDMAWEDEWAVRNPRRTRQKVEWVHLEVYQVTPAFRWPRDWVTLFLPGYTLEQLGV
ncbi:hypothetical protein BJY04DRAFT_88756 [Aspergillus karnatakaensis]|uniref:uncharacterized protein n=1 Tax=Aspergillus karnatakaensis TaxID=1810916 RepID=UPI003CCD686B